MDDQELRREAEATLDHYHGLSGGSVEVGHGRLLVERRARGADRVVIGSDPDDWPKQLYARLGFVPWWVQRGWRTHPS